ncbi:MAG: response regulator [Chloroflexi bacterium]|nr:MAG: response regulator [Chloroflexota bacterium]MBL1193846.1 response regulator [Chloroflexota bacterium]NOH11140.1 response regulator [Chloroflexota bacterium]
MGNGTKLLLVDDEAAITENLTPFLERAGFDVAVATNGAEAFDMIRQIKPDLVVLDALMPIFDI